ncbi:MAG: HAD-IA family hydrolase [Tyzzerella sp.]|nr:HAD-IA family hydrolase [Tyzzerella sp.]
MYDYLIYDFDGTLSDTYPIFTEAFLKMMEKYGIPQDYDTVYGFLKQSVGAAISNYDFPMSKKEARAEFEEIYQPIAVEKQNLFPESEEILRFGLSKNKKNYVYTHSGLWVYALLNRMGIRDCFDFVLDSTYDFPRKPDPTALNFMIEKCGIDKSKALMIGDRDLDIEVAHAAGIHACLIDTDNFYPDLKSEYRIKTLSELKEII